MLLNRGIVWRLVRINPNKSSPLHEPEQLTAGNPFIGVNSFNITEKAEVDTYNCRSHGSAQAQVCEVMLRLQIVRLLVPRNRVLELESFRGTSLNQRLREEYSIV